MLPPRVDPARGCVKEDDGACSIGGSGVSAFSRARRPQPAATTAPKENARQQGFALLVVLWIVTLLALQISIFNLSVRDAGTLAGNELAMARGEALAAAGARAGRGPAARS